MDPEIPLSERLDHIERAAKDLGWKSTLPVLLYAINMLTEAKHIDHAAAQKMADLVYAMNAPGAQAQEWTRERVASAMGIKV